MPSDLKLFSQFDQPYIPLLPSQHKFGKNADAQALLHHGHNGIIVSKRIFDIRLGPGFSSTRFTS